MTPISIEHKFSRAYYCKLSAFYDTTLKFGMNDGECIKIHFPPGDNPEIHYVSYYDVTKETMDSKQ